MTWSISQSELLGAHICAVGPVLAVHALQFGSRRSWHDSIWMFWLPGWARDRRVLLFTHLMFASFFSLYLVNSLICLKQPLLDILPKTSIFTNSQTKEPNYRHTPRPTLPEENSPRPCEKGPTRSMSCWEATMLAKMATQEVLPYTIWITLEPFTRSSTEHRDTPSTFALRFSTRSAPTA